MRAIIWWKTGDADRSTRAAAKAGQAVALAFIAFGIFRFFGGAGIGGNTRLEEKLQSELNHPGGCLHADNLPEGGTAGVIVRNIKLRVVERVEKFGSELHLLRLSNFEVLLQHHVEVDQVWSP